jgi:putative Mg2+ transporter-C (MgtC) family protein
MSVFETVAAEFTDLSATQAAQLAVRLVVAGVLGGVIGWNRERTGKPAGLRTHILVALGAAGVVAVSHQSGMTPEGVARVIQGLLAGIGFLGAGCILKVEKAGEIHGLTTAATIWLTAAIGTAAGLGRDVSALMIALIGWFALTVLRRLEHHQSNSPPGS